jgi:hypothetical protein
LAASAQKPDKVIVVVMTDGEENASKQFTRAQLNERISHQQSKYGWTFLFLGANQDAFSTANSYGMKTSGAMNFAATPIGSANALGVVTRQMRNYKTDGNPSADVLLTPADPEPKVAVNVTVNQ